MIRRYVPKDAAQLAAFADMNGADIAQRRNVLNRQLLGLREWGGDVWVLEAAGELVAYATIAPVPGLSHIGELGLCVTPAQRRRGYGSRLLAHVLAALAETAMHQVSYSVADLTSGAASFLRAQGFFVEHEECVLRRSLAALPSSNCPAGSRLRTLQRREAIPLFCRLYDQSFRGLPWYQPFTQDEVASTLAAADDLLFLQQDDELAGATWLQTEGGTLGIIEPIGVLPAYQGRGLGRCLLVEAMRRLAQRGLATAQIGTWCNNARALRLYERLGFEQESKLSYMAYDLK